MPIMKQDFQYWYKKYSKQIRNYNRKMAIYGFFLKKKNNLYRIFRNLLRRH